MISFSILAKPAFTGVLLFVSLTAHAALVAVDIDGNVINGHEGVYDDVLNVTWLADANLAVSNTFGVSDIISNGTMTLSTANNFITAMNSDAYLGVTTWRLPTLTPLDGSSTFNMAFTYDGSSDRGFQLSAPVDPTYNQSGQSAGFTGSELAYHYYNNLAAIGACSGVGTSNSYGCVSSSEFGVENANNQSYLDLFSNVQNSIYWAGDEPGLSSGFGFYFDAGLLDTFGDDDLYVWAVAPGNVAANAVPLPATVWLFGSALIGLVGAARRR